VRCKWCVQMYNQINRILTITFYKIHEINDEDLFKQPPPTEDCPICCLPLPLSQDESVIQTCCGKIICVGCSWRVSKEEHSRTGVISGICAFCRTPKARTNKESMRRLNKLVNNGNAAAHFGLPTCYTKGVHGLLKNWTRTQELYLRAGELGCAEAYANLGVIYLGQIDAPFCCRQCKINVLLGTWCNEGGCTCKAKTWASTRRCWQ
jgi:hypothetical protein